MIKLSVTILKFDDQGEKTGWQYIEIPADIAGQLKPNNKKSFRVKGYLDDFYFEGKSLLPMGNGNFILALKADIRKAIGKRKGAMLTIKMEEDKKPVALNEDLVQCLEDEPAAFSFFKTLSPGHQKYFSNWIESAKTEATKAKRIANTINAMIKKQDYGGMIRSLKNDWKELLG